MKTVPKFPLAKNITHLRELMELSKTGLAREIDVPLGYISHWERGFVRPSYENLIRLSDYFGITVDSLLRLDLEKLVTAPLKTRGSVNINPINLVS